MRAEKETIRWRLKFGDTEFMIAEFTIFDKEGGKFNLSHGSAQAVIDTFKTPEEATAALAKLSKDSEWSRIFKGNSIPAELSAWTPEPRKQNAG